MHLLRRPPQWPAYHASVADAARAPPANELLAGGLRGSVLCLASFKGQTSLGARPPRAAGRCVICSATERWSYNRSLGG